MAMSPAPKIFELNSERKRVLLVGSLPDRHYPGVELLLRELPLEVMQVSSNWISKHSIDPSYDLVIVPQTRPVVHDEIHAQITDCFQKSNAKPIFMQLLGTWCEGEGRTGKIPEGWKRVFWHQAARWLEAWVSQSKASLSQNLSQYRLIEVDADRQMVETLREALKPLGWYVLRTDPNRTPSEAAIGLWQGTQISGLEASRLAEFVNRFRANQFHAPVIAMMDFPRTEMLSAAKQLGVSDLVGLPVGLDELILTIESVAARRADQPVKVPSTQTETIQPNQKQSLAA